MDQGQRRQDAPQSDKAFEYNLNENIKSTLGCLGMNVFFFIVLGIPLDRLNLLILIWDAAQNWLASSGMKEKSLKKVETAFMMMIGFFILLGISLLKDIQESQWRRQSSKWLFYFHLFRISCFAIGYFYPLIKARSTLRANQEERHEDGQFERNANGAETSVHLKKLDSSIYVIYKYWILISGIWAIRSHYRENEEDLPEIEGFTFYLMAIAGYGMMILNIWHIINCGLVFEAIRRKKLELIQYSIKSMESYSIAFIAIYFFGFGNETVRDMIKKRSIGHAFFDVSSMNWTLMVAIGLLVWRIYYHVVYLYGAQSVRDALKAHERLRHSH